MYCILFEDDTNIFVKHKDPVYIRISLHVPSLINNIESLIIVSLSKMLQDKI